MGPIAGVFHLCVHWINFDGFNCKRKVCGKGCGEEVTVSAFALFGFLGAIVLYAITAVIWRGRLKAVRKSLD